jgi:hypothetical protein
LIIAALVAHEFTYGLLQSVWSLLQTSCIVLPFKFAFNT